MSDAGQPLSKALLAALSAAEPAALVTLVQTKGSTPREAGAAMLVTQVRTIGTIGGGTFEWEAITAARNMLDEGEDTRVVQQALGPEIGQCCGGHVTFLIERASPDVSRRLASAELEELSRRQRVTIYGAGHVGRALALALNPLPFRTVIVDTREDEIEAVVGDNIERLCGNVIPAAEDAPAGGVHVVMTHSHSLDSLICATLLEKGDFAYLGLIGSATKRATFVRAFQDLEIPESRIGRLVCPIGGSTVKDKRPAVIASLVASEIVGVFLGTIDRV